MRREYPKRFPTGNGKLSIIGRFNQGIGRETKPLRLMLIARASDENLVWGNEVAVDARGVHRIWRTSGCSVTREIETIGVHSYKEREPPAP